MYDTLNLKIYNILAEKTNNVLGNVYIYGNGLENLLIGYNVYRYTANAHGDVVKVYSGSTVVAEYDYEAYGENIKCIENGISNPLRYAGYYYDADTEKYYLKNRYYDGTRGRFLTEDPYWNVSNMLYGNVTDDVARNVYYPAIVQSGNRVAYCMGNPVNWSDPSGLIGIMPDDSIYTDENDSWVDVELLKYKQQYENEISDIEKHIIAEKAQKLRSENPGNYKVEAEHPIDMYYIPDITEKLDNFIYENESTFKNHNSGNILDMFWFAKQVKTGAVIDVKSYHTDFQRESQSYHI